MTQEVGLDMSDKAYILVVDDEPINVMIMEELLDDKYEVESVDNGIDCLASIEKRRPDLILLDVNMPRMDGLTVCKELRKREEFNDLPIIMVSALAMAHEKEKGLAAGANFYLSKPFDDDELLTLISQNIS